MLPAIIFCINLRKRQSDHLVTDWIASFLREQTMTTMSNTPSQSSTGFVQVDYLLDIINCNTHARVTATDYVDNVAILQRDQPVRDTGQKRLA